MLIDAWRAVGLERIAQVDLDEHYNRHQPLSALAPMALTVLATIARRVEREGRLKPTPRGGQGAAAPGANAAAGTSAADDTGAAEGERDAIAAHAPLERPPLASLAPAGAAWHDGAADGA